MCLPTRDVGGGDGRGCGDGGSSSSGWVGMNCLRGRLEVVQEASEWLVEHLCGLLWSIGGELHCRPKMGSAEGKAAAGVLGSSRRLVGACVGALGCSGMLGRGQAARGIEPVVCRSLLGCGSWSGGCGGAQKLGRGLGCGVELRDARAVAPGCKGDSRALAIGALVGALLGKKWSGCARAIPMIEEGGFCPGKHRLGKW